MIRSFRHKGLERLYERGVTSGVSGDQVAKLRRVLAALDAARSPHDLSLPGYGLHPLKGRLMGHWSIRVNANWRVVFRFLEHEVHDVDLIDYH